MDNIRVQVKYRAITPPTDHYCVHHLVRDDDGNLFWIYGGSQYIGEEPLDHPILPKDDRNFDTPLIPFKESDLKWTF